ncbi:hypothetical protein [Mycolicibacterium lacusdiani]|uniref:hypothetical protein n=1 Tax=Mycolicibacterium lacusdiani TaxID=2895283 RepID=UPI001F3579D5|nr:hypothetical protein [Mycolicibacterium lacusdiani]
MSVPSFEFHDYAAFRMPENISWWDRDSRATMVISTPGLDSALWSEYLCCAERSYRKHGVEKALDVAAIADGADTAMFWALVDDDGVMLGGVRAKGPLTGADDSHAVVEWAGHEGLPMVRKMIDDRAPFGILEMKSAWTTDDRTRAGLVSTALARSGFHALELMGIQFCMATSAPHILERWGSSGGVVAPIPAAAYPDDRYRTKMMWWDRRTFANHAEPEQLSKILRETAAIASRPAIAL